MSCASSSVAFRPRSATASTTCAVRPLTHDEVREIARHYLDQIVHLIRSCTLAKVRQDDRRWTMPPSSCS